MSYLTEPLPVSLLIGGTAYPVRTDFREILRYQELIREETADGSNLEEALIFLFGRIPPDLDGTIDRIEWFLNGGETEKRRLPKKVLGINSAVPIDFIVDARRIWSAFYRAYRLDLHTVPYLHWWDFLALLDELPGDTDLCHAVRFRTADVHDKRLSREEREYYSAMQRYYRIKDKPTEKEERLAEALKNGEDPSLYL